jgi:serine phosphatase RsbU (regulator of sigma subunit)
VRGGDVEIQDLSSANGTFVNGRMLDQRPCLLADGDQIRLGHLQLRFYQAPADLTGPTTEPASGVPVTVRGSLSETMHGAGPRIEPQLLLARIAQRRMLSDRPPEIAGYEVGHVFVPAQGVGGDFIHWAIANDGRRALVMGDVCGKGVAAAMYMAFVSGLLFEVVPASGNPESILRRLNRSLHAVVEPGLFVTAMAVMLDTRTHTLEIACAGHPPGLIKRADGSVAEVDIDPGLALGPDDSPDFGVIKLVLAPGEVLMVTTDGVEEARNPAGEELGRERVIEVLAEGAGATDAARRLQWTITQHAGQARQHDDLTVVTIERCR